MMISLQKRGATTTPPPPFGRLCMSISLQHRRYLFSLEFHTAVIYMNNVNYEHLQYHWKTKAQGLRKLQDLKLLLYRCLVSFLSMIVYSLSTHTLLEYFLY
jgi:hypothetical protein